MDRGTACDIAERASRAEAKLSCGELRGRSKEDRGANVAVKDGVQRNKVTVKQFLKELKASRLQFYIGPESGRIRTRRGLCPIEALARFRGKSKVGQGGWWHAIKVLGIPEREVDKILIAADSSTAGHSWIRDALEKLCR